MAQSTPLFAGLDVHKDSIAVAHAAAGAPSFHPIIRPHFHTCHWASGVRLGAYEVLSLVGAGGMGEVYKARDTRLNRDIAIKVLPEQLALDPGHHSGYGGLHDPEQAKGKPADKRGDSVRS